MKRVKLIYNPFSGGGKILKQIDRIQKVYQENGYLLDLFRVSYESNYLDLLMDIKNYNHFLISGGDGTINQIINFLKNQKIDIPLGILPLGTSNDFAKNFDMPLDMEEACLKIINSKPHEIDLGVLNERYFVNIASLGIFTNVSQGTDFNLKKVLGKYAYYLKGVCEFTTLKNYEVDIEGENYRYSGNIYAIFVFNGKSAGNIDLAYNASISDGKLDVIIIKPNSFLQIIDIFHKIKKGTHLEGKIEGIEYLKTSWLKVDGNRLKTDLDGEIGPELPISLKCEKGSLKILGVKNL